MTLTSMLRDLNASAIELEAVNEAVMTLNPGAPPVNVDRLKAMLREVETGAEALLNRVRVLRARHVPGPTIAELFEPGDDSVDLDLMLPDLSGGGPSVVKLA